MNPSLSSRTLSLPVSRQSAARPPQLLVSAVMAAALLAGLMSVALAGELPASGPHALTREEVQRDLQAYQSSGLAALEDVDSQSQSLQQTQAWRDARKRYLIALMKPDAQVSERPLSRQEVLADLKAYQDAGLAALDSHEDTPDTGSAAYREAWARYEQLTMMNAMMGHALTRAEVQADLAIYRESGLQAFEQREGESGRNSAAYLEAQQRYESLKQGSRYQTLVMALGKKG